MSESRLRPLTVDEEKVLMKLLNEDFPGRDALLVQAATLKVRQIDAEGSLQLAPGPAAPTAGVEGRVPVEGVFTDDDGINVNVLLHVVDGSLAELEIYKDDLTAIHKLLLPEELRLTHLENQ
jgi:hypothetical protein